MLDPTMAWIHGEARYQSLLQEGEMERRARECRRSRWEHPLPGRGRLLMLLILGMRSLVRGL